MPSSFVPLNATSRVAEQHAKRHRVFRPTALPPASPSDAPYPLQRTRAHNASTSLAALPEGHGVAPILAPGPRRLPATGREPRTGCTAMLPVCAAQLSGTQASTRSPSPALRFELTLEAAESPPAPGHISVPSSFSRHGACKQVVNDGGLLAQSAQQDLEGRIAFEFLAYDGISKGLDQGLPDQAGIASRGSSWLQSRPAKAPRDFGSFCRDQAK